jgi:predicted MPP superfamily phosphohydrolase
MGIDLSLAGHTHSGPVTLEFVSPEIAPSRASDALRRRLVPQPGGQLYVNRGISTC